MFSLWYTAPAWNIWKKRNTKKCFDCWLHLSICGLRSVGIFLLFVAVRLHCLEYQLIIFFSLIHNLLLGCVFLSHLNFYSIVLNCLLFGVSMEWCFCYYFNWTATHSLNLRYCQWNTFRNLINSCECERKFYLELARDLCGRKQYCILYELRAMIRFTFIHESNNLTIWNVRNDRSTWVHHNGN